MAVAGILELPDQILETTIINMLKILMDELDSIKEQMGNVSIEMAILGIKKQ